jgi:hypothetical protein
VALAAAVALPDAAVARTDASSSATCETETKRLKNFKKGMKPAQRRYFKTHKSKKARAKFVKAQRRKLARLKKARARCLAKQQPGGGQPGGDPPGDGGPAPPGDPPATSAIENVVSAAATVADDEISRENGIEFVRTQLELELTPDATLPQLQALLARLNAEIVSSLAGVPILTVRIPDPGSLDALRALVAGLPGAPGLAHADLPTILPTAELPSMISPSDVSSVRPQLASNAHAAWNARAALAGVTAPSLVVGDRWGNGPPGPEVAVQETASDFGLTSPNEHGYLILGLLAGTFDHVAGTNSLVDAVTGTWPGGDLMLSAVDVEKQIANSTTEDRMIQAVQALSGDVVLSTSLQNSCYSVGCVRSEVKQDALQWIQRVRGAGVENRLLHVTAGGNVFPGVSDADAVYGSTWNAAALAPLPGGVANLTNTVVVENTTSSDPANGPVEPLCLTASSKVGGHISAVGNDIRSLSGPGIPGDFTDNGGTSSATPQVSGAAAMVWALDNTLTPQQVKQLLIDTAQPVGTSGDPRCKSVHPAPGLDEYAAVLAVDRATTQPVRSTILDVADSNGTIGVPDGVFDEFDVDAIVGELANGAGTTDYGRFDLNGDGRTGGGTARLDLDGVRPVAWDYSSRRDVLGLKVLRDENAVRDVDVLCHEAAGPRYAGDLTARDVFLQQRCLPPVEIAVDPAFPATVQPGAPNGLRVVARRTDIADPVAAEQPGVRLEFNVTGGTTSVASGVTGADGTFSTSATLVSPASQISIEIIARAGQGGPELDRTTVSATAGTGPITVGDGSAFLVANAESADEVHDIADPNFSDSVSAADKDATASATGSSSLQVTSTGMEFTGNASIQASDDGGGGDASVRIERHFAFADSMPYRLTLTLGGTGFGDQTSGAVQLWTENALNPFFSRTTTGSQTTTGNWQGEFYIVADVGCSPPRPDGGTCTANFSYTLEVGDMIGP